jgi:tRNA nucleotidyltransferase/poly(A) polymerase
MDEDYVRRDFTMNAMYMDEEGEIYDPAGGMEDIRARTVRFIKPPALSVAEDGLRALRYFRFCAEIFPDEIDEAAWSACTPLAGEKGARFDAERARIRAAAGYGKLKARGLAI